MRLQAMNTFPCQGFLKVLLLSRYLLQLHNQLKEGKCSLFKMYMEIDTPAVILIMLVN